MSTLTTKIEDCNNDYLDNTQSVINSSLLSDANNKVDDCLSVFIHQNTNEEKPNILEPIQQKVTLEDFNVTERNKLIEQATNRLKQKELESKLKSFISSLVEIKGQLEIIKLETSISLQLFPTSSDSIMTENQLEHFQTRFQNHMNDLKYLFQDNSEKLEKINTVGTKAPSVISSVSESSNYKNMYPISSKTSPSITSYNSSRLSFVDSKSKSQTNTDKKKKNVFSHISSVLSACSSYKNASDHCLESDYAMLGDYNHHKRSMKRKKLYQNQNEIHNPPHLNKRRSQNYNDYHPNDAQHFMESDCDDSSNFLSAKLLSSSLPSSICSSSLPQSDIDSDIQESMPLNTSTHIFPKENSIASYKRNDFDDVLSYINNNVDDINFRNDLSQLLSTSLFEYSTCDCKSQIYDEQIPPSAPQPYTSRKILFNLISTSLNWFKFILVLFLAIIINLKRGPSSFVYTV